MDNIIYVDFTSKEVISEALYDYCVGANDDEYYSVDSNDSDFIADDIPF